MTSKNIPSNQIIDFAVKALFNSYDLRNSAKLLLDNNVYGLSRSVAISSQEEYGKFMVSINCALGHFDEKRFVKLIRSHPAKQKWSVIASHIIPKMFEAIKNINSEKISLIDILSNEQRNVINEFEKVFSEGVENNFIEDVKSAENASIEKRRQNGLYVSIIDGEIVSPQDICLEDAEDELAKLDKLIDAIDCGAKGLPEIDELSKLDDIDEDDIEAGTAIIKDILVNLTSALNKK